MKNEINVKVDLDKRKVDTVELPNAQQRTFAGYMLIRDAINDFSQAVSKRLSPQRKKDGAENANN